VYLQGSDVQIRTSDHLLGLDLRGWPENSNFIAEKQTGTN
jgi:hypothetical protein